MAENTGGVKKREMTFLTRPAILDDEADVRNSFTFDDKGNLKAFAFFDPIYKHGDDCGLSVFGEAPTA